MICGCYVRDQLVGLLWNPLDENQIVFFRYVIVEIEVVVQLVKNYFLKKLTAYRQ